MLKKLFGKQQDGTTKINGVAGQFEGMIAELESGSEMNYAQIAANTVEIDVLEDKNNDLGDVNTKAKNIRDGLLAIINGG